MLTGFLLGPPAQADDWLVDEVVAVVDKRAITLSEVRQEGVMTWADRGGAKAAGEPDLDPAFLSEVMEILISQRVLLDEALRTGVVTVTEEEGDRLAQAFRRRFPDAAAYERFLRENDLDDNVVREVLGRHLRVERLKEQKLQNLPAITREAVRRYYYRNREALGQAPLEAVAEAIRLKLMTQQRETFLAKWIFELRKRSAVKVLVDFKARGEGG
jgi:hypothetical protein